MKEIRYPFYYCVCENFCDYGSGSAKAKSYGSYGSGSATPDSSYSEKVTDLNKAHHGHEQPHHRHLDLDLGVTSEILTIRVKTSLIFFSSFIVSAILYITAFFMLFYYRKTYSLISN
jgi:hypothetical protein